MLEILFSDRHKDNLIYVMNKARIPYIKGSTVLFPHAYSKKDISFGQKKNHCLLAIERAKRLSSTVNEGTAKTFYTKPVPKLQSTLESLSNSSEAAQSVEATPEASIEITTPRAQSS